MSQTNKEKPLYNQLLIIENTQENRDKVKDLNKRMKEYGSRWRLSTRYRKPKKGHKYGWGGSIKCENANGLGIYVKLCNEARELEFQEYRNTHEKRQTKIDKYENIIKKLSSHILPSGDWWGEECPICENSDIECYDDYADSERWVCNNCSLEWSCSKEQKRYDLTLDL